MTVRACAPAQGCLGRCQNPACGDEMEELYSDEAALTALMTEDDPATEDLNEKAHAWTSNAIQMRQAVSPPTQLVLPRPDLTSTAAAAP